MEGVSGVDGFQRRHSVLGFPLAVVYKYFDDQGPYLASALTYYAFVSIFPLMLLGTSILGLFLRGEPQWQEQILNSALSQFPIIGDELGRPEGLQGSIGGVVFGGLAALYGAMGLGQALQNTQHVAWSVPRNSRPNPFYARFKTLVLLLVAGFSLLAVTVLSSIASYTDVFGTAVAEGVKAFLPLVTILLVGTFLTLLFRYAATGQHSFWRAAPGGYTLAVMWQGLQVAGAAYVNNVLVDTSSMTKTFGLVLGLIGFLWIGAVMAVLAMEINVVWARRLWPRALLTPFTDNIAPTDADRRAYALYAGMQRHKGFEKVEVIWEPSPKELEATGRSGDRLSGEEPAEQPTSDESIPDGSTAEESTADGSRADADGPGAGRSA